MRLNELGEIVRDEWLKTAQLRPRVVLDAFVVVPNHIHGIFVLADRRGTLQRAPTTFERFGKPTSDSIPTIVRLFKSTNTRRINQYRGTPGAPVWQRNYYEHIIRIIVGARHAVPLQNMETMSNHRTVPPQNLETIPNHHAVPYDEHIIRTTLGARCNVPPQNTENMSNHHSVPLHTIRRYIVDNPLRWHLDRYNPDATGPDPLAHDLRQMLKNDARTGARPCAPTTGDTVANTDNEYPTLDQPEDEP
jgi:REP element-mobilizing transposase RayT